MSTLLEKVWRGCVFHLHFSLEDTDIYSYMMSSFLSDSADKKHFFPLEKLPLKLATRLLSALWADRAVLWLMKAKTHSSELQWKSSCCGTGWAECCSADGFGNMTYRIQYWDKGDVIGFYVNMKKILQCAEWHVDDTVKKWSETFDSIYCNVFFQHLSL